MSWTHVIFKKMFHMEVDLNTDGVTLVFILLFSVTHILHILRTFLKTEFIK